MSISTSSFESTRPSGSINDDEDGFEIIDNPNTPDVEEVRVKVEMTNNTNPSDPQVQVVKEEQKNQANDLDANEPQQERSRFFCFWCCRR